MSLPTGPGLYVHVPFCVRRCAYCDFFSMPSPSIEQLENWKRSLAVELTAIPSGFSAATVFIGGGTPSILAPSDLKWLLRALRPYVTHALEWSVEINPGTLTPEKAEILIESGVNRASVGAQTFSSQTLKSIGRIHTREEIFQAIQMLRSAGFDNISLDLMFGLPVTSGRQWENDLQEALSLDMDHISAYALEWVPGTPLFRQKTAGEIHPPVDSVVREEYDILCQTLRAAGYRHYEISNFCKPGRECQHNLLYWTGGEYIGVGPSAHSHWRGIRKGNTANWMGWGEEFHENLEPKAKARETLVMGLRRMAGWNLAEYQEITGFHWNDIAEQAIQRLVAEGRLYVTPDTLRLADDMGFVSDPIFAELI